MINYFILEDTHDDILNLKEVYINSVANPSRFVCLFASGDDAEISDAIESLKANNTKVDLVFIDYELTGIYGTDYIDKIDRYFDKPVKILMSSEIKLEDEIEIVTPLRQNKDKIYYIRKGVEDLIKDKIKSYLDLHFPIKEINKFEFKSFFRTKNIDFNYEEVIYYSTLLTFKNIFWAQLVDIKSDLKSQDGFAPIKHLLLFLDTEISKHVRTLLVLNIEQENINDALNSSRSIGVIIDTNYNIYIGSAGGERPNIQDFISFNSDLFQKINTTKNGGDLILNNISLIIDTRNKKFNFNISNPTVLNVFGKDNKNNPFHIFARFTDIRNTTFFSW